MTSSQTTSIAPQFVDDNAVATILGISVSAVRKDRIGKRSIPFCRINGSVRYHVPTLVDQFLRTAEGGAPAAMKAPKARKAGAA